MVKLERIRSAQAVAPSFRGAKRIEGNLTLLEGKRLGTLEFNSDVWKKAKKQLKAEAHGKCAYCEAPVDLVAHGDVEHFRPKSTYWWLAYCYDNYLFSCQICNETYKKDHFPILAAQPMQPGLPAPDPFPAGFTNADWRAVAETLTPDPLDIHAGFTLAEFQAACDAELAALVNPYFFDPEPLFKWTALPGEVSVQPRTQTAETTRVFEAVEKYFGINRDELKKVRWRVFKELRTFRDVLLSNQLDADLKAEVANQILDMTAPSSPFAGMARYFVNVEWQLNLP